MYYKYISWGFAWHRFWESSVNRFHAENDGMTGWVTLDTGHSIDGMGTGIIITYIIGTTWTLILFIPSYDIILQWNLDYSHKPKHIYETVYPHRSSVFFLRGKSWRTPRHEGVRRRPQWISVPRQGVAASHLWIQRGFPYGYDSWMVLLNKNPKRSESKMDDNWGTPSLGNHHIDVEYVFICFYMLFFSFLLATFRSWSKAVRLGQWGMVQHTELTVGFMVDYPLVN